MKQVLACFLTLYLLLLGKSFFVFLNLIIITATTNFGLTKLILFFFLDFCKLEIEQLN